jgi:hypothetical protein
MSIKLKCCVLCVRCGLLLFFVFVVACPTPAYDECPAIVQMRARDSGEGRMYKPSERLPVALKEYVILFKSNLRQRLVHRLPQRDQQRRNQVFRQRQYTGVLLSVETAHQ